MKFPWNLVPWVFMRYHAYRIDVFVKNIASSINKKNKMLLDIGAENSPYKKYFNKLQYFTLDIEQNSNKTISFVGDLNEKIDIIKSNSFDYILCTQVLEHIKRPHNAFSEFSRILKPGGKLFLTTHMSFDLHMEPNDFFRFTKYGLKSLGEDVGLKLVHLQPHGGIFHVLSYILTGLPIKVIGRDNIFYYLYLILLFVPILIFNIFIYAIDYLDRAKSMTLNYECIYEKSKR